MKMATILALPDLLIHMFFAYKYAKYNPFEGTCCNHSFVIRDVIYS